MSPETSFAAPTLTFSPPTADSFSSLSLGSDSGESPIASSTLRPSTLTKIQEFLLRGERRQAYHIALDEKLWAHAMVIASSIDKDAWKEVVNEFIHSELGVKDDGHRATIRAKPNEPPAPLTNGREWLKVAYSLFSGQGPAAGKHNCSNLLHRYSLHHQSTRITSNKSIVQDTGGFASTRCDYGPRHANVAEFPFRGNDGEGSC